MGGLVEVIFTFSSCGESALITVNHKMRKGQAVEQKLQLQPMGGTEDLSEKPEMHTPIPAKWPHDQQIARLLFNDRFSCLFGL